MGSEETFGAGPTSCSAGSLTPAQMDLVIRSLPVQVSVMDEDGIMVYWRGDGFDDCDPDSIGAHVNESHNADSQRKIADIEASFRDGSRNVVVHASVDDGRQMLTCYAPLRSADGAYRGMVSTMQDITGVADRSSNSAP